jgi:UDP-N-acetylmuramate--alanine ligase
VVFEACEYDRSFLDFYPKILILTNIEEEHLDTYPGGISEIKAAFSEYITHVPDDGLIIACADDENVVDVLKNSSTKAQIIYYGRKAEKYNQLPFSLAIPGKHNELNAMSVLALCDYLKIDQTKVEQVLTNFSGAKRRFEKLGQFKGADLIDDYGHHPTEIAATLEALASRYADKKRIVVFWPHQYKRILPLIDDFAKALQNCDFLILKPIYFVPGRDEVLNVSSDDLAKKVISLGTKVMVMQTDEEIANYLVHELDDKTVLLTIGIPPVYKVIEKILEHND